jgi:hypothetical protein
MKEMMMGNAATTYNNRDIMSMTMYEIVDMVKRAVSTPEGKQAVLSHAAALIRQSPLMMPLLFDTSVDRPLTDDAHEMSETMNIVSIILSAVSIPARKDELLAKLRELATSDDKEAAHGEADAALRNYIGDADITDAYNAITKWCA